VLFNVPVNLIRQWCYCPRIVYYIEFTDFPVKYPLWVHQGEHFHVEEGRLWQRRNLTRFGLSDGAIHLNMSMHSDSLGIHGIADMVIETTDAVLPVEFKLDKSVQKRGGILQLVAYGLLAEEHYHKSCNQGFLTEGKSIVNLIPFNDTLRRDLHAQINGIRQMIQAGVKPDSSASIAQCTICEYLNHCNDRG